MRTECRKFAAALLFLIWFSAALAWSQESTAGSSQASPAAGVKGKIEPVFPIENENLVFVEGEDAVSTNFAREPVLNYSCSGQRTLQLSQASISSAGGSFYADYVFRVPTSGIYELWYGGTPPGPREDLYPSYASPFQVIVDGGKPIPVSRESVTVTESYSPSYYWNRVGDLSLEARTYKIRFEVAEKRRLDNRFLLYIDCFFLVRKEGGKRVASDPLPAFFPKDPDTKTPIQPFLSVDDYLIRLRDAPGSPQPAVDLSLVYTMLGDYLNALKYLNRALLLDPASQRILLFIAKNRIWKGDVAEGLRKYRELLARDPRQKDIWMEAGKVAAWMGRYEDSIGLYTDALASFPGDPDLLVNLSLTYLWAGRGSEAEQITRRLRDASGADAVQLKQLGRIYRINGYPERALEMYLRAAAVSPPDLEAYLFAQDVQQALGREADAQKTGDLVSSLFFPSPRLTQYLEGVREKQGMKEEVIREYRQRLAEHPDELALRQVLAQTYFWNGKKAEAIEEYRHILANHEHKALAELERSWPQLLFALDRGYLLRDYLARAPEAMRAGRAALDAESARVKSALAARTAASKALDAARAEQAKRGAEAEAKGDARSRADADKAAAAAGAAADRLSAADTALTADLSALAVRSAEARNLAAQLSAALAMAEADEQELAALRERDTAEQLTFSGLTRANKWRWDSDAAVRELSVDAASDPLSRLVLARVYLAGRQTAAAQKLLAAADAEVPAALGGRYLQARTLIWGGQARDGAQRIAALAMSETASTLPGYFLDLTRVVASLSPAAEAASAEPSAAPAEDPLAEAAAAAAVLSPAGSTQAAAAADRRLAALHQLYARAVSRALYGFEETTAGIRNELGDYYLGQQNLDAAILQFRKVLALDPNDLSARFRLGKVYEWGKDWSGAREAYAAVYRADPGYENAAGLYNQIEREHSHSLGSSAWYLADSTHSQWHGEAAYSLPFNSVFSLTAAYQADMVQVQRTGVMYRSAYGTEYSGYALQDASLALPMDLYVLGLKLIPQVGGVVLSRGLYAQVDSQAPFITTASYPQGITAVEPYAQAALSLAPGGGITLGSTARLGRYAETFDSPPRNPAYDASIEMNLSLPFSFIDVYPLRDTTLRAYGKVDYLTDAGLVYRNTVFTGVGELTVHLLKGGSPYSLLTLIPSAIFQNSLQYEPYDYYSPMMELTAGASIMGSTWIGIGDGAVLGLSLRGYGGAYTQRLLLLEAAQSAGLLPGTYAKLEGQVQVSLTQGGTTWTLDIMGNSTVPWSYWSLYARLGCALKVPRLLAP
jgi:Flp pilus assembly protein TadD